MSTATCPAIGCGRPAYCRGYCRRCYCRRLRRTATWGLVDATPARHHVTQLRQLGWTWDQIGDTAGVAPDTIRHMMRRAAPRCRADFAAALLSVPAEPTASILPVPAHGTRRRLQALMWMGWPMATVAARIGVSEGWLYSLRRAATVPARLALLVHGVYGELAAVPGPSRVAAGKARARGYAPPAAWDEDTIDDPKARPRGVLRPARGAA